MYRYPLTAVTRLRYRELMIGNDDVQTRRQRYCQIACISVGSLVGSRDEACEGVDLQGISRDQHAPEVGMIRATDFLYARCRNECLPYLLWKSHNRITWANASSQRRACIRAYNAWPRSIWQFHLYIRNGDDVSLMTKLIGAERQRYIFTGYFRCIVASKNQTSVHLMLGLGTGPTFPEWVSSRSYISSGHQCV